MNSDATRFPAVRHACGSRDDRDGDRPGAGAEHARRPTPACSSRRPRTRPMKAARPTRSSRSSICPSSSREAQKILPPGGFGYISGGSGANWTRRENMAAFERVQIDPQPLGGIEQGRPHDRDPRLEAVDADLRAAHGQPRPRARVEGGRHRQGRARGRHADADLDAVEPQHGGDRRRTIPGRNGSSSMYRRTAASCANCCSAPRPPATPPSRRPSTTSSPIRARRTSATSSGRRARSARATRRARSPIRPRRSRRSTTASATSTGTTWNSSRRSPGFP